MSQQVGPVFFVGIDWAATEHAVCVVDQTGRKIAAFTIGHTAARFTRLAAWLDKLGHAERVPVAIERPDGRLVDAMLAAGHPVLPVKPTAIKTWRESDTHPDGALFRSFPHAGTINAAQILAEWGNAREVFDNPDAIAALAGITPVTKAADKQRGVSFRWACNKRLRAAITTFATNSRFSSPWATDIYHRARASEKDHPHATRVLARAWIRVMWRCWQNGTIYDPVLHGAALERVEQQAAARLRTRG
ncbi:IS110 family transposase [Nocardia sp. CA-107356]|uniref:IS110 family transposase n=1 Tax=Nocardia sp. CA-107356 TaxID=3239972 RepID=UPI003D8BB601